MTPTFSHTVHYSVNAVSGLEAVSFGGSHDCLLSIRQLGTIRCCDVNTCKKRMELNQKNSVTNSFYMCTKWSSHLLNMSNSIRKWRRRDILLHNYCDRRLPGMEKGRGAEWTLYIHFACQIVLDTSTCTGNFLSGTATNILTLNVNWMK